MYLRIAVAALTLLSFVNAHADLAFEHNVRTLKSHIMVVRLPQLDGDFSYENRYVFKVCNGGECRVLGAEAGYSKLQLTYLYGRLQQVGGVTLGAVESALVLYTGISGVVIGATAGSGLSIGGAVAGGTVGVGAPVTAINMLDWINPFEIYRQGYAKNQIESSIWELVATAQPALILFESIRLDQTLFHAEQINKVLLNR